MPTDHRSTIGRLIDKDAAIRLAIKRADHDAEKEVKGFCSNPFCLYCDNKYTKRVKND